MKRTLLSLLLVVCVGCKTTKKPVASLDHSSREVVELTISKNNEAYTIESKFTRFDLHGDSVEESKDVVSCPTFTSLPNTWALSRVVQEL